MALDRLLSFLSRAAFMPKTDVSLKNVFSVVKEQLGDLDEDLKLILYLIAYACTDQDGRSNRASGLNELKTSTLKDFDFAKKDDREVHRKRFHKFIDDEASYNEAFFAGEYPQFNLSVDNQYLFHLSSGKNIGYEAALALFCISAKYSEVEVKTHLERYIRKNPTHKYWSQNHKYVKGAINQFLAKEYSKIRGKLNDSSNEKETGSAQKPFKKLLADLDSELFRHFQSLFGQNSQHPLVGEHLQRECNKLTWETLGRSSRLLTGAINSFELSTDDTSNQLKNVLSRNLTSLGNVPIRVSVHAMQVSTIGALLEMKEEYADCFEMDIHCPSSSSQFQLKTISEEQKPHFIVTADAGVYYALQDLIGDYTRCLSVWSEEHVFLKNYDGDKGGVYICGSETTQELHKSLLPSYLVKKLGKQLNTPVPEQYQEIVNHENANITLCMTKPKATPILGSLGFHIDKNLSRNVVFGLYAGKSNLPPSFSDAFRMAFINAYRQCAVKYLNCENPHFRRHLQNKISNIKGFKQSFASGVFFTDTMWQQQSYSTVLDADEATIVRVLQETLNSSFIDIVELSKLLPSKVEETLNLLLAKGVVRSIMSAGQPRFVLT